MTVPVVMHTTLGDIHVALEVERAPITAQNFLRYVDSEALRRHHFYRAMKVTEDGKYGLVQGGLQAIASGCSSPSRMSRPSPPGFRMSTVRYRWRAVTGYARMPTSSS